MKKHVFILCLVIMFLLLISSFCIAANLFNVEIADADKKQVTDIIINDLISWGYSIVTVNEYQLSFRKDLDNSMDKFIFGTNFNRIPESRVSFNIISINGNVKITLEVKIVSNPGSGYERSTAITDASWQSYLNNLKAKFNGQIVYGMFIPEKKKERAFEITEIIKNSSAEKEGLVKGDLILMINDIKTSALSHKELFSYLEGPEGSTVKLLIKTIDGNEKTVTLTKTFIPGEFQKIETETATALP